LQTAGKKLIMDGGLLNLTGTGTITSDKVEVIRGKLRSLGSLVVRPRGGGGQQVSGDNTFELQTAGREAEEEVSVATLSGDYSQGSEAVMEVEIGGTEPGLYGQLWIGGTADFEPGTGIALSLVDPDDPTMNANPFSPALGEVFDIVTAEQILVPDPSNLNDLFVTAEAQLFERSIVVLPDNRQALRLTTVATQVPEPSTLLLAILGLAGLSRYGWYRKR